MNNFTSEELFFILKSRVHSFWNDYKMIMNLQNRKYKKRELTVSKTRSFKNLTDFEKNKNEIIH